MIYFLMFFTIALTFFSLIFFEGKILSPAVIFSSTFMISVMAAIYNSKRWHDTLNLNTVFVLSCGMAIFVGVSCFVKITCHNKHVILKQTLKVIEVNSWAVWGIGFFSVFISGIYLYNVQKIVATRYGRLGWTQTMFYYRNMVSYANSNLKIPILIEQSYQMLILCGLVTSYILINNYLASGKKDKPLVVLTLLLLVESFLDSSRLNLIIYLTEWLTIIDFLLLCKRGEGIVFKLKTIFRILILFLLFCLAFLLLKQVAGRIDDRDPVYYITYYLGQSIHNLNEFLSEKHTKDIIVGRESFYGLNHLLYLITGHEKYNYIAHKEFRYIGKIPTGNVYTVFRAYIHDFGYIGMVVLTALFSMIMNIGYQKIRIKIKTGKLKQFDLGMIVYAYLSFSVYTAFFTNYFFNRLISAFLIKLIFIIWFWYMILVRIKIVRGKKIIITKVD